MKTRPPLESASGTWTVGTVQIQGRLLAQIVGWTGAAALTWSLAYLMIAGPAAAVIPLGYGLLAGASFVMLRGRRAPELVGKAILAAILVLPVLQMGVVGGFVDSGAVVMWSFLGPTGALLLLGPGKARAWLLAYLALLAASALFLPVAAEPPGLPPWVVTASFVVNIAALSSIVFLLLSSFVTRRERLTGLLREEQARSDRLLLNVLPAEIAGSLKRGQGSVARHHEAVSVLFADIVGFTSLSAEMEAQAMVELLNSIFSRFDELVDDLGVEKIRTIGDNYMVVAGAPRDRLDHAHVLVRMGLRMIDESAGTPFQFRIGVNSGPVIAGVIGTTKFHYDVWGDTVNVASRMESQGVPGRVQIGGATHALVNGDFRCTPRGDIELRGRGRMPAWLVDGPITPT